MQLKDLAKKHIVESRAAFTGAIHPYGSAAIFVVEIDIVTTDAFLSKRSLNALAILINE